jgi:hypothetical protein
VSGADYSRQRPSATQRIVLRLMRKRAAEIERSTREWILTCPHCGLERTLWDIGGVRWDTADAASPNASACAARAASSKATTRSSEGKGDSPLYRPADRRSRR